MSDTRLATPTSAVRTWWWHPKPVVGIGAESAAARTWWWHPKPIDSDI